MTCSKGNCARDTRVQDSESRRRRAWTDIFLSNTKILALRTKILKGVRGVRPLDKTTAVLVPIFRQLLLSFPNRALIIVRIPGPSGIAAIYVIILIILMGTGLVVLLGQPVNPLGHLWPVGRLCSTYKVCWVWAPQLCPAVTISN
jgi:hypothetical protein